MLNSPLDKQELKSNKQEATAKAYALEGLNQSDAYRKGFNTSKMLPNTIHRKAYDLFNDGKFTARIDYLKTTLTEKVIEGFAKSRDDLLRSFELLIKENEDPKIKIDCLKEQGKLLGYYVNKTENSGTIIEKIIYVDMKKIKEAHRKHIDEVIGVKKPKKSQNTK